jgi:hypothetical protein
MWEQHATARCFQEDEEIGSGLRKLGGCIWEPRIDSPPARGAEKGMCKLVHMPGSGQASEAAIHNCSMVCKCLFERWGNKS